MRHHQQQDAGTQESFHFWCEHSLKRKFVTRVYLIGKAKVIIACVVQRNEQAGLATSSLQGFIDQRIGMASHIVVDGKCPLHVHYSSLSFLALILSSTFNRTPLACGDRQSLYISTYTYMKYSIINAYHKAMVNDPSS